ncbi:DUF7405 family protein [Halomicrobium zhouii]|uniref:DUF7405 family protein n=1 Tax=Halomicrobium zhouii TaxID=767519 RepID=UPI000B7F4ADF|nr:hypothetical protein [Halomicrobium zhouii]
MKSALAIGGASALSAVTGFTEFTGTASAQRSASVADRDNRQHAWTAYLDTDARGLAVPPRHHVLLFMNYQKNGEPSATDRLEMETALRQLEEAFEWSNDGLLFTTNYSPEYFGRFNDDVPPGVDLRPHQDVIDAIIVGDEDPTPEPFEILLDLASDNVANLLAAEEALWGERDELNGVTIDATFEGIFDRPTEFPARRTGFVGGGLPREEFGDENISAEAPLSMGFQSVFEDNIPSEDDVSMVHDQRLGADSPMPPGVFAQGSIQHVSNLSIDLDSWYDQPHEERVERMYSPHHSPDDVGETGNELGRTSGVDGLPMRDVNADDDVARRAQADAEERGVVGHEQKLARARFDLSRRDTDGESDGGHDTTILRRDFNTADIGKSGLHFLALMRFNGYMVYVRQAMNGVEFSADESIPNDGEDAINHDAVDIDVEDDGFLAFITALRRGNYLVPPLTLRSLPPANATEATLEVKSVDGDASTGTIDTTAGTVDVTVTADGEASLDPAAARRIRFGPIEAVNRGGGAAPDSVGDGDGSRDQEGTEEQSPDGDGTDERDGTDGHDGGGHGGGGDDHYPPWTWWTDGHDEMGSQASVFGTHGWDDDGWSWWWEDDDGGDGNGGDGGDGSGGGDSGDDDEVGWIWWWDDGRTDRDDGDEDGHGDTTETETDTATATQTATGGDGATETDQSTETTTAGETTTDSETATDSGTATENATATETPTETASETETGTATETPSDGSGTASLQFDVDAAGFGADTETAKLLWIDEDGLPVEATTSVTVGTDGQGG